MKKSKFYLLSGFLGLVATTLIVSSLASAHGFGGQFDRGNISPERQQAMEEARQEMEAYQGAIQTALDNGDYEAWKTAIDSHPRITNIINADNFGQFVQMHNYMQEGDFEAAQEIRDELGLENTGPMMGMGFGRGWKMGHQFRGKNLAE